MCDDDAVMLRECCIDCVKNGAALCAAMLAEMNRSVRADPTAFSTRCGMLCCKVAPLMYIA